MDSINGVCACLLVEARRDGYKPGLFKTPSVCLCVSVCVCVCVSSEAILSVARWRRSKFPVSLERSVFGGGCLSL